MMKMRLDNALVERGLAASRTVAQSLVMGGKVRVNGQVAAKSALQVSETDGVDVEAPPRFVSRGGEKLEGAFASFPDWSVDGLVCLDVGSSTGGFTDCMLQHGAKRVMAVDVGTNQLAWKLRSDPRVWVKENFNARYMKSEDLPEVPQEDFPPPEEPVIAPTPLPQPSETKQPGAESNPDAESEPKPGPIRDQPPEEEEAQEPAPRSSRRNAEAPAAGFGFGAAAIQIRVIFFCQRAIFYPNFAPRGRYPQLKHL